MDEVEEVEVAGAVGENEEAVVVEVEASDHTGDDVAAPPEASDVVPSPGAAESRCTNRARSTWTLPSLPRGTSQARRLCPEQLD